jgi:hypothetical protein
MRLVISLLALAGVMSADATVQQQQKPAADPAVLATVRITQSVIANGYLPVVPWPGPA